MDTTSSSARQSPPNKHGNFIDQEIEATKTAMKSAATELWEHVPSGEDLQNWTKANPLLAVGIAAGAGAVAGFLVTPSRGGKASKERDGGKSSGLLGSVVGTVFPMLSMAASEAGRAALAAATAKYAGEQAAEDQVQEDAGGNGFRRGAGSEAA